MNDVDAFLELDEAKQVTELEAWVPRCFEAGDVEPLCQILQRTTNPILAAAMVRQAFPERRDSLRLPEELEAKARALLAAVALCNTVMDELFFALNTRGFTTHKPSLARFADPERWGPLDEDADGKPRWAHLRTAMDEGQGASHVLAQWERPGSAEVLAAAEDALRGYMTLHLPFPAPSAPDKHAVTEGFQRLTILCRDLIVDGVDEEDLGARLRQLAEAPRTTPPRLAASLVGAWHGLGATDEKLRSVEGLVARGITFGTDAVLRPVVKGLDAETRERLVMATPVAVVRSGSGFVFHGCLPYLDLVPTPEAARRAVDALVERDDPPVERLVEILSRMGPSAHGPIDEALARGGIADSLRDALERARQAP